MITASLTTILVTGLLSTASLEVANSWQTDYAKARTLSLKQNKPIAVFIANGDYSQVIQGQKVPQDTVAKLQESFVLLRVNTTTSEGQKLANSFQINQGLVISDTTGSVQALRHAGILTPEQLQGYVQQYGQSVVVTTTAYRGAAVAPAPASYSAPVSSYPNYSGATYSPAPAQPIRQAFQNTAYRVGNFVQNISPMSFGSS